MIAIYHGKGVSWQGEIEGALISAEEIAAGGLKKYALFIMPGGRDRLYHEVLRGAGNEAIRSWVEEGGLYFGICAGAYYGCKRVEFDKGYPLEVCEERELSFFQGVAEGPAYGKGTYAYDSEKGARIIEIGTDKSSHDAYYNGGCTFRGDFSSIKVLACYLKIPGAPPAIIECSHGKGKAILSGVHLEKSGHFSQYLPADQMKVKMKNRLPRL